MKRLKFIIILVFLMSLPCRGAINTFTRTMDNKNTYKNSYRWTGKSRDFILEWAQEAEDRLDGTTGNQSFYFAPGTAPTATEGRMYYDSSSDTIKYYNGSSAWVSLAGITQGSSGTLDDSYNDGFAIDVDGTAVTLTVSDGDNNAALIVNADDATNNANGIEVVVATSNTGAGLYVNGTTGTIDLLGDNFSMANTGALTLVGIDTTGDIILANDEFIDNDTDSKFEFDSGAEDFTLDLSGANIVGFASDTSAVSLEFNALDKLIGVESITFDDAAATISLTSTGATDLTIQQATADQDASLILQSAGTGTDALSLISSVADISLVSADNVTITVADNYDVTLAGGAETHSITGGDFSVDSTDASVTIDAGQAADDAIVLVSAAGGLDLDFAKSIAITTTESESDSVNIDSAGGVDIDISGGAAGEDFAVTTDTSITLTATENHAGNTHIEENGGTSGGINIFSNQGTGVSASGEHDASIQLHTDDGGIGLYSTANLGDTIRIEANGGADENIFIQAIQGTGADSITLTSTVGGIAITANAASKDVVIKSVLGSISLEAERDVANAMLIVADGGTASTLELFNDTGTSVTEGAAAISLVSDVGGINLYTNANLDNAIVIQTDGGTTAEMTLWADQGNATDSIELLSDAGGITLTAAKPVFVSNAFEIDCKVHPTTTPLTILAVDSGQVHMIPDTAADVTINLPAEADNLHYKFVYVGAAADAHDWIITSGDDTEQFVGGLVLHDSDGELTESFHSNGSTNSKLGVLTPEAGTFVEMWYDLATTSWYVTGTVISATNVGVTFANQ